MSLFDKKPQRISFRQPKIYARTSQDKITQINKGLVWLIIIITGLAALGWWLFYSNFFRIKNIEISGTLNEEVKQEIEKFRGKNILLFSITQLDKKLFTSQSSIEELNIIKGIPNTIKVEVLVRRPQIRWKTQDKIYFIDEQGIAFNLEGPNEELDKLVLVEDSRNLKIELGKKVLARDFVEFVKELPTKISESTQKEIENIKINETTLHLEIQLRNSFRILFDTTGNLDEQIYLLKKIKEAHESDIKEYVDLRVEGKAYYK